VFAKDICSPKAVLRNKRMVLDENKGEKSVLLFSSLDFPTIFRKSALFPTIPWMGTCRANVQLHIVGCCR